MAKKVVIVARDATCLQLVFGIPAIRRLVLIFLRAGISNIHILVSEYERLAPVVSDLVPKSCLVPIPDGHNRLRWIERIGDVLCIDENDMVIIMPANMVIDDRSLHGLLGRAGSQEMDGSPCGANLDSYGIYMVEGTRFPSALNLLFDECNGRTTTAYRRTQTGTGCGYCIDGTEQSIRKAENSLLQALGFSNKGHDSFLARHIDRPIARLISGSIARTRANPNMITIVNLLIGLAGAGFFAMGGYWNQILGSVLFLINVMGDGVDGDVARLKLKETSFGHYLDIISDNIVHIAVFAGIAVGLERQMGSPFYLQLLLVLLAGFGLCAYVIHGIARAPNGAAQTLLALVDNRDFSYLVLLLSLFGLLHWFLIGASIGVYLVSSILLLLYMRELFTERTAGPDDQPVPQKTNRTD